jgi:hypothetical protein
MLWEAECGLRRPKSTEPLAIKLCGREPRGSRTIVETMESIEASYGSHCHCVWISRGVRNVGRWWLGRDNCGNAVNDAVSSGLW